MFMSNFLINESASAFIDKLISMPVVLHKAIYFCDAMTSLHQLKWISCFVFSSGPLPQQVCYFPPIALQTIVSSLVMLMRQSCWIEGRREEE